MKVRETRGNIKYPAAVLWLLFALYFTTKWKKEPTWVEYAFWKVCGLYSIQANGIAFLSVVECCCLNDLFINQSEPDLLLEALFYTWRGLYCTIVGSWIHFKSFCFFLTTCNTQAFKSLNIKICNIYKNNSFFKTIFTDYRLTRTGITANWLCKHYGTCYSVCSCVCFCLHTVESDFWFMFECVITTDYGIQCCADRVEGAGRTGSQRDNELISSSPTLILRWTCYAACCLESHILLYLHFSPPHGFEWLWSPRSKSLFL